jgi:hypothetical protein
MHTREASTVLRDPAYTVPPVPAAAPASVAWLRASVARFSSGAVHSRRRGLAVQELAAIDPARLREAAAERAVRALAGGVPLATVARRVPVELLAESLGAPAEVVPDVLAVARVYLPAGTPADAEADRAVERLVAVFGADEPGAARIGLLAQACEATAGLILRAVERGDRGLLDTLRSDPPVRGTRRIDPRDGTEVFVDFGTDGRLAFGAGAHECPGREHAMALAAGVVEAAWADVASK